MDYTETIRSYFNEIFKSSEKFHIKVDSEKKFVVFQIDISKHSDTCGDILIVRLSRDIKDGKSVCYFKNGCPSGRFELSKTNMNNFMTFLTKRGFFRKGFIKKVVN